jgi:hypothetical protein
MEVVHDRNELSDDLPSTMEKNFKLPGAEILTFDDGKVHHCSYEETDSYKVTEMFINDRERLLKELLQ